MNICFTVFCRTKWGQQVFLLGSEPELGAWNPDRALKMAYTPDNLWKGECTMSPYPEAPFKYKYIMKDDKGSVLYEELSVRRSPDATSLGGTTRLVLSDTWNSPTEPDSVFLTAPFTTTMFRKADRETGEENHRKTAGKADIMVRLQLINRRVKQGDMVCVTGTCSALGEGEPAKARPMNDGLFPVWTLDLHLNKEDLPLSYKYLIKDKEGKIVIQEDDDRLFDPEGNSIVARQPLQPGGDMVVNTDNAFTYKTKWRGAGIALPVFSIRSDKGLGVGEFLDLKDLADWAHDAGLQVIQMLPVNDTSTTGDGGDFCPYSCISIFALHPIYLNLEAIGSLPQDMAEEIGRHKARLNQYPILKHREVISLKLSMLRRIFDDRKNAFLSSSQFHAFLEEHGHWLEPYAAFCALCDRHGTLDFSKWREHRHGTKDEITLLTAPGSEHYDAVAFYYFVQYHLHLQLLEAAQYAREKGVVLKGDIPIGIQKGSDSCWANPELFHMNQSTGAPPDPFSDAGQNWGFPTYNWEEMARDNYSWWRRRLDHMSQYFQIVRLDHVLGFFRIWEIPHHALSALLGHFSPAIPLTREELESQGIWDFNRLCEPYISESLVEELFGNDAEETIEKCLDSCGPGRFSIKPEFATQRQVEEHLSSNLGRPVIT